MHNFQWKFTVLKIQICSLHAQKIKIKEIYFDSRSIEKEKEIINLTSDMKGGLTLKWEGKKKLNFSSALQ